MNVKESAPSIGSHSFCLSDGHDFTIRFHEFLPCFQFSIFHFCSGAPISSPPLSIWCSRAPSSRRARGKLHIERGSSAAKEEWTKMDDYTREMMDLKTLVTRTLEKKGVLAKIRVIPLLFPSHSWILSCCFVQIFISSGRYRSSTRVICSRFLGIWGYLCCWLVRTTELDRLKLGFCFYLQIWKDVGWRTVNNSSSFSFFNVKLVGIAMQ